MRFNTDNKNLADALGVVRDGAKGSAPTASAVELSVAGNTLGLRTSGDEMTITHSTPVAGSTDGTVVVAHRLIADIAKALPAGSVDIEVNDNKVTISGGRAQFDLNTLLHQVPAAPQLTGPSVDIDAAQFVSGITQVLPAVSNDQARPILTGALIRTTETGVVVVATDSYRLAVRSLPGVTLGGLADVIVPGTALAELARRASNADQVAVHFSDNHATFTSGPTSISTPLIEGDFPPYERLIPTSSALTAHIDRVELLEAVRRLQVVSRESNQIRLQFTDTGVNLDVNAADVGGGHDEVDAKVEGPELTVGFNPNYLADGLASIPEEAVVFTVLDGLKPVLIRGEDAADFTYLVMPVRLT